jgi:hypothetical protein
MDIQELKKLRNDYEAALRTLIKQNDRRVPNIDKYVGALHEELQRLQTITDMHSNHVEQIHNKHREDALATACHWTAKCQVAEAALKNLQEAKPWWKFW